MAKRNASSGRSGGRTSGRSDSGKSFSGRKKSTDKPYGKSERGGDSDKPKSSFGSKRKFSSDKRDDSAPKDSARRSASSSARSYPKKFDRENPSRSEGTRTERGSSKSERPFKRDDKRSESTGSGFKKDNERPTERKSRSSFTGDEKKSERPEKRFDRDSSDARSSSKRGSFDKPFRKKTEGGEDSTDDRKEFVPAKRYESNYKARKSYSGKSSKSEERKPSDPEIIRLNRYIANSGLCSRREADEYIKMGLVTVNGKVVTELGHKVNRSDEVRYEDKVLKAEKPVYILMNKPKGFLTTTKDPEDRNTVMHILGGAVRERVYPVGRLDRNTTGLLLLTNDGDLADKLMHPSYNVKKIYKVELDRPITKADFKKIQEGVRLEEGKAMVDDLAIVSDDGKTVGIELHIGWNRVVRRIFESLQYEVVKLDRSVYAGLDKKDLPRGHWRFLKKEEVVILKHYKK
ncbi:MAG TPA: pseudouridine synthase [Cyclobacteriaceae bacterium]|nr:pseudouridine synthase [Cyclobacteriaceae bacterium]